MSTIERAARHLPRTIDRPIHPTGLLAACSRQELAQIGRRCDVVEVDAGASVQPVQPLHWVYVVLDGLLAVTRARQRAHAARPWSRIGHGRCETSRHPAISAERQNRESPVQP